MSYQQEMTQYLLAFINGLKKMGLKEVVISPGSRSTPLALLLHRQTDLQKYVAIDERSAAFLALGLSKVKKEPVALVCTSGTAAANYYPAICEAYESRVPLLVLTTDRPFEVRNVGAPQTMAQTDLYGKHVKHFVEMALPQKTPAMLRYSFWQAIQLMTQALQKPCGPVHANLPLREPLLPDLDASLEIELEFKQLDLTSLLPFLHKRGMIVCGEALTSKQAWYLQKIAHKLGWPLIADPLSNVHASQESIHLKQADLIFSQFKNMPKPEVVLRFGKLPVAKNVMFYLKSLTDSPIDFILCDENALWHDSLHQSRYFLQASLKQIWQAIADEQFAQTEWSSGWQDLQSQTQKILANYFDKQTHFDESLLAYHLTNILPTKANLFVANSNAIRFVDRLSLANDWDVYGNRGVNGIDGTISTAIGVALNQAKPTYLLTGDLTLFHDLTGLQLAKHYQPNLTIILLNNDGGGIFSFLPQNKLAPSDFEPLFQTPLGLCGQKVAKLYDFNYQHITDLAMLQKACNNPKGVTILEVKSQAKEPVEVWQELCSFFAKEISHE
ncbi:2-succinyl-5-enolpyruvyl-6-hydroxy-3-cyclohexene-1-carboxylic-acid synthase [Ligilactobacillus sp. Marseille-Q7487]|uniref:2-succinyl-5-enolpyruvyl-6-hydroxy-3- cyclohexene-1-carboxylic-acid synthase n=1 Tax=Ligilactobacillus sp. Marseille-Q7487 TaxID=3022128 RepID=UPI0024A7D061|nr:2-succinyl-5-enolpyruvyl-6-hydroxy-3-cyclohexene-1-carboxylic-acid synthase [Ligilactobacillus sp. Marseille-Q7487]